MKHGRLVKKKEKIEAAETNFVRSAAGYSLPRSEKDDDIAQELKIDSLY